MDQPFVPTHIVSHTDRNGWHDTPVMLIDGCLYTALEWAQEERADWEIDAGQVLFLGQIPVGEYWLTSRDEILHDVENRVDDDGTGDIGVIVDQALRDGITSVDEIVAIVREAQEDWRAERAHLRGCRSGCGCDDIDPDECMCGGCDEVAP